MPARSKARPMQMPPKPAPMTMASNGDAGVVCRMLDSWKMPVAAGPPAGGCEVMPGSPGEHCAVLDTFP